MRRAGGGAQEDRARASDVLTSRGPGLSAHPPPRHIDTWPWVRRGRLNSRIVAHRLVTALRGSGRRTSAGSAQQKPGQNRWRGRPTENVPGDLQRNGMAVLHDTTEREALCRRVLALRGHAMRRWGRMSVDQMLHHVNVVLEMSMGLRDWGERARFVPLPRSWLIWMVLALPWPRSAPTAKAAVASDRYSFEAERSRCLELVDAFAAKPLDSSWPEHFAAGRLTGPQYSRLQHKHLDHHLRQFGA